MIQNLIFMMGSCALCSVLVFKKVKSWLGRIILFISIWGAGTTLFIMIESTSHNDKNLAFKADSIGSILGGMQDDNVVDVSKNGDLFDEYGITLGTEKKPDILDEYGIEAPPPFINTRPDEFGENKNMFVKQTGQVKAESIANTYAPNTDICYHKDERLAAELTGFMLGQGHYAIRCDSLLKTNDYENLQKQIFEAHKNTIKDFMQPMEKFIARYNLDSKEYVFALNATVYNLVENQPINKDICKSFYEEMQLRKSNWRRIISQVLAATIIYEYPINNCHDDDEK